MFDWLSYKKETLEEFASVTRVTEMLIKERVKLYNDIHEMPVYEEPSEESIKAIEAVEIGREGRPSTEVTRELLDNVFSNSMLIQHPRFLSFVPSAVSPYSLIGSILTDLYNPNAGGFSLAPEACIIEEKLVKWMASLAGYPETAGGVFLSGGSMSNMSAMVLARDNKLKPEEFLDGRAYVSDQTHSSLRKGLRILGFQDYQIVTIPTDEAFKMRTDLLEEAIKKDIADGKRPFTVIGTIGTTNTGSIDPLEEIAKISKKYDLWFHIDGAFGGSILISDIYRNLAKGIEQSDSFSWDTHKWMMQVYSCATLVVRDKKLLLNSFTEHPEYLADMINEEHTDSWDMGPEMSRPHRAIKLWLTVQASGTDALADIVDYAFYNAKTVQKELEARENWEIISQPSCGTINFRYHPEGMTEEELSELNHKISDGICKTGYAFIVTTTLNEKTVLRVCTINANTRTDEIVETVRLLDEIARNLIA